MSKYLDGNGRLTQKKGPIDADRSDNLAKRPCTDRFGSIASPFSASEHCQLTGSRTAGGRSFILNGVSLARPKRFEFPCAIRNSCTVTYDLALTIKHPDHIGGDHQGSRPRPRECGNRSSACLRWCNRTSTRRCRFARTHHRRLFARKSRPSWYSEVRCLARPRGRLLPHTGWLCSRQPTRRMLGITMNTPECTRGLAPTYPYRRTDSAAVNSPFEPCTNRESRRRSTSPHPHAREYSHTALRDT